MEVRKCKTCWHWHHNDCGLGSCKCTTALMEHEPLPRWLSRIAVELHIEDCKQCQAQTEGRR